MKKKNHVNHIVKPTHSSDSKIYMYGDIYLYTYMVYR